MCYSILAHGRVQEVVQGAGFHLITNSSRFGTFNPGYDFFGNQLEKSTLSGQDAGTKPDFGASNSSGELRFPAVSAKRCKCLAPGQKREARVLRVADRTDSVGKHGGTVDGQHPALVGRFLYPIFMGIVGFHPYYHM